MSRRVQNGAVLLAAVGAALAVVHSQSHWLTQHAELVERERCYGVVRPAGNDCATPKHSCAAQAVKSRDAAEWIMVPKGICEKLAGGITESL